LPSTDVLSLLAELAIAIAGFSGIVAVFGRRSAGEWTSAEGARLAGLLTLSLTAALFSVLPLVVLSIPVSEVVCLRPIANLLRIITRTRAVPIGERESSLAMSWAFVTGNGFAVMALLVNAFLWKVAWPYLAAILWSLTQAAALFARLVMVPLSTDV